MRNFIKNHNPIRKINQYRKKDLLNWVDKVNHLVVNDLYGLRRSEQLVLNYILSLSNQFELIYVSQERIAKVCGLCVKTVTRAIKRLRQERLIATCYRSRYETLLYRVHKFFYIDRIRQFLAPLFSSLFFKCLVGFSTLCNKSLNFDQIELNFQNVPQVISCGYYNKRNNWLELTYTRKRAKERDKEKIARASRIPAQLGGAHPSNFYKIAEQIHCHRLLQAKDMLDKQQENEQNTINGTVESIPTTQTPTPKPQWQVKQETMQEEFGRRPYKYTKQEVFAMLQNTLHLFGPEQVKIEADRLAAEQVAWERGDASAVKTTDDQPDFVDGKPIYYDPKAQVERISAAMKSGGVEAAKKEGERIMRSNNAFRRLYK